MAITLSPFEMRGRWQAGFTLVELMVTVAMLAVLAVVTLPPVLRALQRREAINASQAVMDLIEYAKVQAAARNRAYRVTWNLHGGESNGRIVVQEGLSSACISFSEQEATTRILDLRESFPTVHLIEVRPNSLTSDGICIKPDGRVLDTYTQMPIAGGGNYAAGNAVFVLQRTTSTGFEGQKHLVVVPFNGAARLAFER